MEGIESAPGLQHLHGEIADTLLVEGETLGEFVAQIDIAPLHIGAAIGNCGCRFLSGFGILEENFGAERNFFMGDGRGEHIERLAIGHR